MCEQESRKREEEEKPFSSVGRARQVPRLRVTSPLSLPVSCYSFSCSINKAKKAKKTFKKRNVTDDQPVWFILTVGHHFFLQICLPYIWICVSDLTNLPIFLPFSNIAQEAKFKFLLSIREIIVQTTKIKPQTSCSSRSSFTTRHRILAIKFCISRIISPESYNYTANHRERDSTFQFYHFNM